VDGKLFFAADDGVHGPELWMSDGTPEGTAMVKDVNQGASGSSIGWIKGLDGRVFFGAYDGVHGVKLWTSDGTEEGTRLLKDISPGFGCYCGPNCSRYEVASLNGRLFLMADDGEHGLEPWTSDGTPEGTVLVEDLNPGPASSSRFPFPQGCIGPYSAFFPVQSTLFFTADDGTHGLELWALPLEPRFHRGDPDSSGTIDISDGITIFGFLFLGNPATLSCKESADANNDGRIDISDGIYLLNWLFIGGPAPAAPGPTGMPCGFDPDPPGSPGDLGCGSYDPCN
jgi:ELWxxDGT repeat protein